MTKDKSIFIKNIYYMLSYAFTTLKESVYDDIQKESFDNIHNLFAAILAKGIGLQLKQGLYREYINRVENLPVVRGKIDMPGTIKNRLEHRMIVTCDYDELSENNLLNQILKSTVFLLLRQNDVQEKYKAELKKEIGDIDVYQNELYLGVEYFLDGEGKNIQVAVYDGDTLELKRVFPFRSDTGQLECSGIAVDPDTQTVYMSSWIDDESSSYLYMYDLGTGAYKGKLQMKPVPKWIQGVAYYEGRLYVTCDDGNADDDAPDHMYQIEISEDRQTGTVVLEKTFDDVKRQGEIEGLTFDGARAELLLLYNRGARIIAGMPSGFYEGYDHEIHEVFVYKTK